MREDTETVTLGKGMYINRKKEGGRSKKGSIYVRRKIIAVSRIKRQWQT